MNCDHCGEEFFLGEEVWNGNRWQCTSRCIYKKYYTNKLNKVECWEYNPFGLDILVAAISNSNDKEKDRTVIYYGERYRNNFVLSRVVHPKKMDELKKFLLFM